MAMQIGNGKRGAEINVTPLIDVLLVLLIIFMIITPTRSVGLEARIPQLPAPDAQPPDIPTAIVVAIAADRSITVNNQAVTLADLGQRLQTIFAMRPNGVLFLQGAPTLDFQDVADVLQIAHNVSSLKIALMPAHAG